MKKVVLFFGIAAAVALASCGNKQACQESQEAQEVAVEEVLVVDSAAADSAQAVVVEEVAE